MNPSSQGRFDIAEKEDWLRYLDNNGYVIIKEVANSQERGQAISLLWDFLEDMPGEAKYAVRRDDSVSWRNGSWFPSPRNGIANGYGMGQSKFLWYSRLLPKVSEAFRTIWGVESLLVSFDGGNVFR